MATTKITNPDLFDLASLNTALQLPSGTTAERPTSPSTGEWRYNTTTNLVEFWDGGAWRDLQSEDLPPVPSENFEVVTYQGTGASKSISSLSFSPSFVWIKRLDASASHFLTFEKIETGKQWSTNSCSGRTFNTDMITSFDSNGFTLGSNQNVNLLNGFFVAYCFNINEGVGVANTDGSSNSNVEVNDKTKISFLTYSGNGFTTTVGHGLGVAPDFLFTRDQNNPNCWWIWHKDFSFASNYLQFSSSSISSNTNIWNNTVPDSSVFSLGNDTNVNGSGRAFMTFAMASVDGFSKADSYTGNGSTNGPVVNTGFEPAFLIIKRTDSSGNWIIYDNKRSSSNPREKILYVNLSNAENNSSSNAVDFLTNGFQIKNTSYNANGGTYIYIAFAADQSAAPVLADSFANKLYTGTGSPQSITGLGFSPLLVWLKSRNQVNKNVITDVVRGANKQLFSDSTDAQSTSTDRITSFDADGFTLNSGGTFNRTNNNGTTYASWNWKANPIPTINTDGSSQSVVSANQAAGFSIVQGTASGGLNTVNSFGHGLGVKPDLIIIKSTSSVDNWYVYNSISGAGKSLYLNDPAAEFSTTNVWANTEPTASVFSIKDGQTVSVGATFITYCFASISGFSKIGSYTGNGSSSGPTVTTGFQPSWIMIKRTDAGGTNWNIMDSTRGNSDYLLAANTDGAEVTSETPLNTTSTGFVITESSAYINASGGTYIYMAFKENPAQYPIASGEMGYLVVAAGGSGGGSIVSNGQSGGGGAGGLRTSYGSTSGGGSSSESNITLAAGTYTITVGGGGSSPNTSGNDSLIAATGLTTITSVGGGGGSNRQTSPSSGGSGAGAPDNSGSSAPISGAAGTANQGYAGGDGGSVAYSGGGGGGGASATGDNAVNYQGGDGGDGLYVSITGSLVAYAGGGGGGSQLIGSETASSGGFGGGGNGGVNNTTDATAATANTGGGGGGGSTRSSSDLGKAGGSGVVILRLRTSEYSGTTTGSPTVTTVGTETVLTYTGSGTYVHS